MKTKLIRLLVCFAGATVYAVTNIVITVPVSDAKYSNLERIASNQNQSVEMFLSNSVVREIEGQRVSMLMELWGNATPAQQENALQALRN